MALSGFVNPYPGKLSVVAQGALADLLLVDGNALERIDVVADPDRYSLVIMKGGMMYKDFLPKWTTCR
jgi:imidazolonepropionase-like amidohydrolase